MEVPILLLLFSRRENIANTYTINTVIYGEGLYTCFNAFRIQSNPFLFRVRGKRNFRTQKYEKATAAHNSTSLIRFPVFNAMGIFRGCESRQFLF